MQQLPVPALRIGVIRLLADDISLFFHNVRLRLSDLLLTFSSLFSRVSFSGHLVTRFGLLCGHLLLRVLHVLLLGLQFLGLRAATSERHGQQTTARQT